MRGWTEGSEFVCARVRDGLVCKEVLLGLRFLGEGRSTGSIDHVREW